MSQLDRFLDDALAGFDDDDEGFQHISPPASVSAGVGAPAVISSSSHVPQYAAEHSSSSSHEQSGTSQAVGSASAAAAAAAGGQAKGLPSLQFDPLKRKKKAKPEAAAAAAAAAGAAGTAAARPALTPQVQQLQDDLAKLVSEWSQAMHPESDAEPDAAAAAANQQRSGTSVLAALAEQTQRTVEQQSRMRPPPAGPAAAAAAAAATAGGGGEQMNAIVDVVMQHLLSKDVLYQPMKEIMEKYPPWLDRQAAAAGSSSSRLSPEELERYKAQYDCITRLVAAYESEPDNTAKIMALLQEMQACGEPPADIVQEMSSAIAADLPLDAGVEADNAAAGMNFDGLDFGDVDLEQLPQELKNCPVQ